ncbi:hypothetical protein H4R18_001213 [Coemansia javaensis]|uniref:Uncharacterized protein n=1 Tax=Coemansia javaensis TaxID=2761396 RepID=A0A9W8HFZ9_9FUNG|nr:hypothetical protein H4R18_001213 [Coemansia javaensis]
MSSNDMPKNNLPGNIPGSGLDRTAGVLKDDPRQDEGKMHRMMREAEQKMRDGKARAEEALGEAGHKIGNKMHQAGQAMNKKSEVAREEASEMANK